LTGGPAGWLLGGGVPGEWSRKFPSGGGTHKSLVWPGEKKGFGGGGLLRFHDSTKGGEVVVN